jgi:hypothetical protein
LAPPAGSLSDSAALFHQAPVWANAGLLKLLQPERIQIELHEKEKATLDLKLMAMDETDAVRRKLGL